MVTVQARKQRKALFNLPNHRKQKQISAHLSPELRRKYGRRSISLRTGDTVVVLRGESEVIGFEGKISAIYTDERRIAIESLTMAKADEKQVSRQIHPSNVMVTKLALSDNKRREKLERVKED